MTFLFRSDHRREVLLTDMRGDEFRMLSFDFLERPDEMFETFINDQFSNLGVVQVGVDRRSNGMSNGRIDTTSKAFFDALGECLGRSGSSEFDTFRERRLEYIFVDTLFCSSSFRRYFEPFFRD